MSPSESRMRQRLLRGNKSRKRLYKQLASAYALEGVRFEPLKLRREPNPAKVRVLKAKSKGVKPNHRRRQSVSKELLMAESGVKHKHVRVLGH